MLALVFEWIAVLSRDPVGTVQVTDLVPNGMYAISVVARHHVVHAGISAVSRDVWQN